MNWKPIETAPKDGTYILLAGDSGYTTTPLRVAVAKWEENYFGKSFWRNHAGDWFLDGGEEPIYWMPLPPAPSAEPAPQSVGEYGEPWNHDKRAEMHVKDSNGNGIASFGASWNNIDDPEQQHQKQKDLRDRAIGCVNLPAARDLSQVVVLDKKVVDEVRAALQYGCASDKFTRELCREALASLNAGGEG